MEMHHREQHHVHITRRWIVICDGPRCDNADTCPGVDVMLIETAMDRQEQHTP